VPRISEAYLEPALQGILAQFPFVIRGFYSDNGSEFINQTVAKLLNKLMIQQTKSRPRHCNDNGLAETKNGAVIRKHMGWGFIDATQADRVQQFYTAHLNPYLNYHRPCAQADVEIDSKGRKRRHYRRYQTPLETLLALPQAQQYLRPALTLATLKRIAQTMSDTEAARRMQAAKHRLFTPSKLPMVEGTIFGGNRAVEMTLWGKPLRAFRQSLEIAARFPHSHSPDYCYSLFFKSISERNPQRRLPFSLQAHLRIGKGFIYVGVFACVRPSIRTLALSRKTCAACLAACMRRAASVSLMVR
jgi:transposase InsO family protein